MGGKLSNIGLAAVRPDLLPVLTYAGLGAEILNFVTEESHVLYSFHAM